MCYSNCSYQNWHGECTDPKREHLCNDTVMCPVCSNMNNYHEGFEDGNCSCCRCTECEELLDDNFVDNDGWYLCSKCGGDNE